MPKIDEYVFSLSMEDFKKLCAAVDKRIDKQLYGVISFEEAAMHYGRPVVCPKCGSKDNHEDGFTLASHKRFKCEECGCSFTILSNSIFNSAKIAFHKLMGYITLISFNVPLELCCEVLNISSNTADLWRKKIFKTVDGYQDHLKLYGKVFIDETYIEDYEVLIEDKVLHPRGLSRTKICIVVAIDQYKNMIAVISGHGKPSSKRIYNALRTHIQEGSTIIHDGDRAHDYLIEKLNCKSEVYKANSRDPYYLKNMALINNMCGWLKRYLWRFIGMDINNLQSYLNWFIYLQRCKRDNEKWPKTTRILRHLVLTNARLVRKTKDSSTTRL